MKKFDVSILTKLVDKYERSVLSKSGSKRTVQITIKSTDPILNNYWSEDSYLYRDQIHLSLDKLSKLNLIFVSYDYNKELGTITLNTDMISEAYKYLNRNNPRGKDEEIVTFLSSITTKVEPISSFAKTMIEKLQNYKSITSYVDNLENLKLCVYAIEKMTKLDEDTLKRNFSKKSLMTQKCLKSWKVKYVKSLKIFQMLMKMITI